MCSVENRIHRQSPLPVYLFAILGTLISVLLSLLYCNGREEALMKSVIPSLSLAMPGIVANYNYSITITGNCKNRIYLTGKFELVFD